MFTVSNYKDKSFVALSEVVWLEFETVIVLPKITVITVTVIKSVMHLVGKVITLLT